MPRNPLMMSTFVVEGLMLLPSRCSSACRIEHLAFPLPLPSPSSVERKFETDLPAFIASIQANLLQLLVMRFWLALLGHFVWTCPRPFFLGHVQSSITTNPLLSLLCGFCMPLQVPMRSKYMNIVISSLSNSGLIPLHHTMRKAWSTATSQSSIPAQIDAEGR